eukprot:scaffold17540_cov129-Isochrysis_galbana.AAC.1
MQAPGFYICLVYYEERLAEVEDIEQEGQSAVAGVVAEGGGTLRRGHAGSLGERAGKGVTWPLRACGHAAARAASSDGYTRAAPFRLPNRAPPEAPPRPPRAETEVARPSLSVFGTRGTSPPAPPCISPDSLLRRHLAREQLEELHLPQVLVKDVLCVLGDLDADKAVPSHPTQVLALHRVAKRARAEVLDHHVPPGDDLLLFNTEVRLGLQAG